MNTPTDAIFYRYWNAIAEDWPEDGVSAGAARLALRLAIGDAYAAGAALADDLAAIVASQAQATPAHPGRPARRHRTRPLAPDAPPAAEQ